MKKSFPDKVTKQYVKNLETLLHCINSIFKNINAGGCGHFALMLGKKLEAEGHNVSVVCLQKFCQTDDIEEIKRVYELAPDDLEELNSKGAYLTHIMLKVDDYFIDSTGIYNDTLKYPDFQQAAQVNLNKLESWCNSEGWNTMFDLEQLPKMQHLINKYFNQEITMMKKFSIMVEIFG